ncbi:MAG: carotenoid biosynthesis protein [Verrucomicrobiae bacterium]|nr:carotenoid biosynthesis protein [Verrucomicrobiae bacterium]
MPPALNPAAQLLRFSLWVATILTAGCWLLLVVALAASWNIPGHSGWPEAVLVLAGTAATLLALGRHLPGQNVILAAGVIALSGGLVHTLGVLTAVPFGPFAYGENAGPRIFNVLAWPIPALWIIAVLSSRGVARLILRPWRKLQNYGFWLLGVTAGLTVVFDAALEPFATRVQSYWLWLPTRIPVSWHGTPLVNFLGWLLAVLLILAFATPMLINKSPRPRPSPPDYHPLGIWLGALALFALGSATHGLWSATVFCGLSGVAVGYFALRGARQ